MKRINKPEKIFLVKLCVLFFFVLGTGGSFFFYRISGFIPETIIKAQVQCPANPPVTISSQPPSDVCLPSSPPPGVPFQFFDDFSWRTFVALVWPAKQGQRGVADMTKTVGDPGPLVFETYKADWEVFQPNGAEPSAWNEYAGKNPCNNVTPQYGDLILESFTKFSNLGQAGFGNLVGPLVAQNRTYVRYQAAFDEIGYTQILNQKLYLKQNLGSQANPLVFNNSSINIKSAWIDMTDIQHPERYYTRTAWILNLPADGAEENQCLQKTVGLVGLHIVVKTPLAPQWIWASFEQVDNVPQDSAQQPLTFNDGSSTLMPVRNPIAFPPPEQPPAPFNVTRTKPISSSTQQTNAKYQEALKNQGNGAWQFYQLVMTQWPVPQNMPNNPGSPGFTFPGNGATTGFANTTMETFFQARVSSSCMACHNLVKAESDFNWTLDNHAFSPNNPVTPLSVGINELTVASKNKLKSARLSPELQKLKLLMQQSISRPPNGKMRPAGIKKTRRKKSG